MGFNKPSKIQETALPVILSEPYHCTHCFLLTRLRPRNIIAQAQSGTGKTAAFVLGMLSRVESSVELPQALCVCPTRELARQIQDVVTQMGKFTKIQTQLVVKDMNGTVTNSVSHSFHSSQVCNRSNCHWHTRKNTRFD